MDVRPNAAPLAVLAAVCRLAAAQELPVDELPGEELPEEILPFVDDDRDVRELATGDQDGDGDGDYLLILEAPEPPAGAEPPDPAPPRSLRVVVRGADGKLSVAARSDRVVYGAGDGGMMGDPYAGVEVQKGRFSVSHYGGSAWRWGVTTTFAYSRRDDAWQLVEVRSVEFHASDADETRKEEVARPPKDFGKIDLRDYDPEKWRGVGPK